MGKIVHADYETVTAPCDACGGLCVLNRLEDFRHPGPYWGENTQCPHCHAPLWIHGDTLNPPHQLFLFAAQEHFRGKRYMLAVAAMAQAWELFFGLFAAVRYVYRPCIHTQEPRTIDLAQVSNLSEQLSRVIRRCAFARLRNLLVNTVARDVAPVDPASAATAIQRIGPDRLFNLPRKTAVAQVSDSETRELLQALLALQIGELRNDVLHHRAYRPRRSEVEPCLEAECELLYHATYKFEVIVFEELYYSRSN